MSQNPINVEEQTSSISVDERTVSKHTIIVKEKGKRKRKEYVQYRITLPREFAEEHNVEKMYLIADSIGVIIPDKKVLLQLLSEFPKIRELVLKGEKYENINQIFDMWEKTTPDQQLQIIQIISSIVTPTEEGK